MTDGQDQITDEQRAKATAFRKLHQEGIFVMPCAWDATSALIFERAGFLALGTTSGGVNWSRGRQDYVYRVDRDTMLDDYRPITDSVSLPISGDLENGYGADPDGVADTIRAAILSGLVGGSIEDQSSSPEPGLIPKEAAVERIVAAREAADGLLPDFTITGRAESYFGNVDDPFADAVDRTNRYRAAGADCVFVPGLPDLETIARFVDAVDGPVSVGVESPGSVLNRDQLGGVGVRRISTGGALPRAVLTHLAAISATLADEGIFDFVGSAFPEDELNGLLPE